jgi:hypothetical protein
VERPSFDTSPKGGPGGERDGVPSAQTPNPGYRIILHEKQEEMYKSSNKDKVAHNLKAFDDLGFLNLDHLQHELVGLQDRIQSKEGVMNLEDRQQLRIFVKEYRKKHCRFRAILAAHLHSIRRSLGASLQYI